MPLAESKPALRCAGRRAGFRAGPAAGCLSPLKLPPASTWQGASFSFPSSSGIIVCEGKKKKPRPQVPCRGWRLEERGCMPPHFLCPAPSPTHPIPHFFLLSCAGYFEAISPVCVQGLEGRRAECEAQIFQGVWEAGGRRQKGPASK